MKYGDLAWGALLYANANKGTQGMRMYDDLVSDQEFLERLQRDPLLDDFGRLREFLVHFGARFAPKRLPMELMSVWPHIEPHVKLLRNETLETCDFSNSEVQNAVKGAFGYLLWSTWGGDTATSKVIHFFNVHLFVMWDDNIHSAYEKPFLEPEGYLEFLQDMQIQAKEVIKDFQYLSLPGSPTSWLSQRLGYQTIRPLAKFLDEFNWITITQGWPSSPPDWLLNLYSGA